MQFLKTYEEFAQKRDAFALRVKRDFSVAPKKFGDSKLLSFYVRISLEVDTSQVYLPRSSSLADAPRYYSLEDVKLVKYELHRSYYNPIRIAETPSNGFEIGVWTYGFYPIQALVLLQFGQTLTVRGKVEFPVTEEEKALNRGEVSLN